MKKIKKTLIAILLFIIAISTVSAKEEIFEHAWSKDVFKTSNSIEELIMHDKIDFQNGYIIAMPSLSNEDILTEINYYNYKGELLKSKKITNEVIMSSNTFGDYLYLLMLSPTSDNMSTKLIKMDKNLNIISEKQVSITPETSEEIMILGTIAKYVNYNYISIVNNTITIFGAVKNGDSFLSAFFQYDLDLSKENIITFDEFETEEQLMKEVNKYYPFVGEAIEMYGNLDSPPNKINILSDTKYGMKVYNGIDLTECESINRTVSTSAPLPCYISSVIKLTNNNNTMFDIKNDNYLAFINAKIIGNYIVAIGIENIGDISKLESESSFEEFIYNLTTEVVVFNMQGEVVQTIRTNKDKYVGIVPSNSGFIVNKITIAAPAWKSYNNFATTTKQAVKEVFLSMNVEAYNLPKKIEKLISGEGVVSVIEKTNTGESVTFELTPKKGFVLGTVKVYDSYGNEVIVSGNSFIMPSTDVTIEATFLPENPNTSKELSATISLLSIIIGGTIGYLIVKKDKKPKSSEIGNY